MTLRTLTINQPLSLPLNRIFWALSISTLLGLAGLGILGTTTSSASTVTPLQSADETTLVALTNHERTILGLSSLTWNPVLYQAAQEKAKHILAEQYFDHTSPSGVTPWSFIRNAGYTYQSAGENLAVGFQKDDAVVQAWMKSPSHRSNIIDSDFQEIAIVTESGLLDGEYVTVVVQLFGQPDSVFGELERQVLGATNQSD